MAGGTGGHVFPGARAGTPAARAVAGGHLARHRARARVTRHPGRGHPDRETVGRRPARQGRAHLAGGAVPSGGWRWCRRCASCGAISPVVVVGLGGFVTGPGGVAAWLTRRPLAHPRAERHRRASPTAAWRTWRAWCSRPFPAASAAPRTRAPSATRCAPTSAPCRRRRRASAAAQGRCASSSSAAARVRRASTRSCPTRSSASAAPCRSTCATRPASAGSRPGAPATPQAGVRADVRPFIEDMSEAYAWADLVDLPRRRAHRVGAGRGRGGRDPGAASRTRSTTTRPTTPQYLVRRGRGGADRRPRADRRAPGRRAAARCAPGAASCSPWPSALACWRGRAPPTSSPPRAWSWRGGPHERQAPAGARAAAQRAPRRTRPARPHAPHQHHPLRRHRRQRHVRHRRGAAQPRLRGAGLRPAAERGDGAARRASARASSSVTPPRNVAGADVVVVSSAVARDNPEVAGGARAAHPGGAARARCSAS